MKLIKKTAILLSAVFFINTASVQVMAAEKNINLPELTFEEAVKKAQEADTSIKKLKDDLVTLEETRNNIYRDIRNSNSMSANVRGQESLRQNEIDMATAKYNASVLPDSVELSVLKAFVDIFNAEDALVAYDKSLALDERNFAITEVKKSLGLISDSDYQNAKTSLDKTKASRKDKVQDIENVYRELNRLMNINDTTKKYQLVFDFTYEELGNFDLSSHINTAINSDQTIKTKQESAKLEQTKIDNYTIKNVNESTWEILDGSTTRNYYERTIDQLNRDVANRKKTISDTLTSSYDNIIALEREYAKNSAELENMYKQLEIKEVQLELGKITQIEVDTYKHQIESLEAAMVKLVYSHYLSVFSFSNLNIAV